MSRSSAVTIANPRLVAGTRIVPWADASEALLEGGWTKLVIER